jgi:hypothetical protein
MKLYTIILLLNLTPLLAMAQIKERTFNNELIPSNLKWEVVGSSNFEPIRSRDFKKWASFWESDRMHVFSKLDLTGDGRPEYLVTNNDFPSGGRFFLVLEKKGSSWVQIAAYQGGTILAASDVKKGYAIHVLGKAGYFYFMELKYNGFKYHKVYEHTVPDFWNTDDFIKRWQTLNRFESN